MHFRERYKKGNFFSSIRNKGWLYLAENLVPYNEKASRSLKYCQSPKKKKKPVSPDSICFEATNIK